MLFNCASLSAPAFENARFCESNIDGRESMMPNSFAADQELIRALEKRSSPISCGAGNTLFSQGEVPSGIFILRSGEAALIMKSSTGRAVMCTTVGPGSVLGLPALIGKQPYSLSVMVKKGSEVGFINQRDFELLLRAEPSLYPKILEVLASEIRFARKALCDS
jgi:CRP-like cAMP-binding protein